MKKKKYIALLLIFILIVGSGCIQKKVSSTNNRNYIVYNMEELPEDLLMLNNSSIRQEELILCLFEGLVSTDANGNIIPALSDKWSVSENKLTYNFHIREGAKWSDNTTVTATDYVTFFSKVLSEGSNVYSNQLQCIFGVKDYVDKKIDFDGVAITAKDDENLEIRLNYPCSYFLEIISQPMFTLRKNFLNLKHWKNDFKKIKYTGPFILDDIYSNGELALKKNKNYWDNESVATDKIHITSEGTTAFALAKYNLKQIDGFTSLPPSEMGTFESSEKLVKGPTAQGVSLNFNLNKDGILRDVNFRKFINLAINKSNMESELNGILKVDSLYIPNNIKGIGKRDGYVNINKVNNNLEKTLADNKYKGEKLKLVYLNSDDRNRIIANSIAKDMKKVNISIINQGYNKEELKKVLDNKDYHILLTSYVGEYDSPFSFLEKWISTSDYNISGYKNFDFDSYVLRGRVLNNLEEAGNNFRKAEEILLKDVPFIPLGFYNTVLCKKSYINGIEINKRGNIILKKIYAETSKDETP
ncbi:peptide ABC transporter substrate-binding protein [Clostridium sp. JNZ J1-5]